MTTDGTPWWSDSQQGEKGNKKKYTNAGRSARSVRVGSRVSTPLRGRYSRGKSGEREVRSENRHWSATVNWPPRSKEGPADRPRWRTVGRTNSKPSRGWPIMAPEKADRSQWTDQPTDRPTDRPTGRPTDRFLLLPLSIVLFASRAGCPRGKEIGARTTLFQRLQLLAKWHIGTSRST